jgi:hypothetical protein
MTEDFKETDEFKETYLLSSGFRVELFNINGPVYIECHDTDEAQVHIVRRAANPTDLDHGKVITEQSDEALVVRGAEEGPVTHEVALNLPRRIALVVESISGPLHIGAVDGPVTISSVSGPCEIARMSGALKIKSVSGNVEVGQFNGGLRVFSVSGSVSAGIVALDENGVQVKSISGPVELFFEDKVDADMNIEQVSGTIDVQLEGATRNGSENRSSVHVVAGEGTWPVSISSVSGPVRITRRV